MIFLFKKVDSLKKIKVIFLAKYMSLYIRLRTYAWRTLFSYLIGIITPIIKRFMLHCPETMIFR